MSITGKTQVFFVVADPVEQVKAPELFNEVFRLYGVDAVVVPLQVKADDFASTIRSLFASPSTGGVFLSIPHKPAGLELVDTASPLATAAGAVNAIRRSESGLLEGDLFDGTGFIRALERAGAAYQGKQVLLIGAGGAASAIAVALAEQQAGLIAIYDPAPGKAEQLAMRVNQHFQVPVKSVNSNNPSGFDLVVNASPLGMRRDDPVPADVTQLLRGAAVYDVLMKNQPTPLIQAALQQGLIAEPGFDMLIQQIPLYLQFFDMTALADKVEEQFGHLRTLVYPSQLLEPVQGLSRKPTWE